jgi:hypothetical protein
MASSRPRDRNRARGAGSRCGGLTPHVRAGGDRDTARGDNGSDSNPGTLAAPLATVQKAVSLVTAGGTIAVRGGTYAQTTNLQITKSGTSNGPITLTSYASEKVIIDGEHSRTHRVPWVRPSRGLAGVRSIWRRRTASSSIWRSCTGRTASTATSATATGSSALQSLHCTPEQEDRLRRRWRFQVEVDRQPVDRQRHGGRARLLDGLRKLLEHRRNLGLAEHRPGDDHRGTHLGRLDPLVELPAPSQRLRRRREDPEPRAPGSPQTDFPETATFVGRQPRQPEP